MKTVYYKRILMFFSEVLYILPVSFIRIKYNDIYLLNNCQSIFSLAHCLAEVV